MSDTAFDGKMVERVRKLLALANNNANENEAATAAAMAQRLIAEHGLELAQIEASSGKRSVDEAGVRVKQKHDRSAMYKFQRELMETIAKNNFCYWWMDEEHAFSFGKMRKVKRHNLIGRQANIAGTLVMYDYLISTMDRLLPWQGTEKRGKDALAWLDGCSTRLMERLRQMRQEMVREGERKRAEEQTRAKHPGAAPGTALVLAEVYTNEEELNEDVRLGLELGTHTRLRLERDARYAARKAELDAEISRIKELHPGTPDRIWELMRYGYSFEASLRQHAEAQKALVPAEEKKETDLQRARREAKAKEKREDDQWRARWRKQDERHSARVNNPAFRMGATTADKIGLDQQIDRTIHTKIGG